MVQQCEEEDGGADDPTAIYNKMDDAMWKSHER